MKPLRVCATQAATGFDPVGSTSPVGDRVRTHASLLALLLPFCLAMRPAPASGLRVEISFPSSLHAGDIDGRMFLMISKDDRDEPRFEIGDQVDTQQFFGVDVNALAPGQPALFDASTLGYPLASLRDLPAGDYYVQGLLDVYTVFHRADGHTLKLPMDEGEGQQWNLKPGNLYSTPVRMHVDPAAGVLRVTLNRIIPPLPPPPDTEWIKHIRIQSKLLTAFWGQPIYLGAIVIVPMGWASHPNERYPLMVEQGHFEYDLAGKFRNRAPGSFYDDWTSGKLPRMLLMDIQHANPYYDDSYAVNSANLGPYGDAITQELIPEVERRFRGIGQGWARVTYGGSTGGWEALASQIFYPDFYNGAWGFCPDPVDFHKYQIVDIYDDPNAYWLEGPWSSIPRPDIREGSAVAPWPDGTVTQTMERGNIRELVLGTNGRSTDQFDIWQAVFGPVGPNGYPANIYDPRTGVIDKKVAAYWRAHYDLTAWLQSHWSTLGPRMNGRLHITVGDMDTYYLNDAVYLMQRFFQQTANPHVMPDFDFGRLQPHCYTGAAAGQTPEQKYMPSMAAWIARTAPPGGDTAWQHH